MNSKVTLSLPSEAAERLQKEWQEDPEGVKAFFEAIGFPLLDIKVLTPCLNLDKVNQDGNTATTRTN